jgi:ABC-2 type transport system ATP-binding protein
MQAEFERLVREVVAEGRTVFLSSHDLDEVQRLADRLGIVKAGRLVTTDTVAGFRERAPKKVEARFARPVDPSLFAQVAGVKVTSAGGVSIALDVTGPIGPVLKLIAEHDPVDVVSRHADLDELFLGLYRSPAALEPAGA